MIKNFFKSDHIIETEGAMERMLSLMGENHYKGEREAVEYFREEYKRLAGIHAKEMEEWLAIW